MSDLTPEKAKEITDAIDRGDAIVCYTKCWACTLGQHVEPAEWHTWADKDDIEHAKDTGQPDPSTSRCGCWCAEVKPS
jgi:hypothetical protein